MEHLADEPVPSHEEKRTFAEERIPEGYIPG
jgi:hypothetical protein